MGLYGWVILAFIGFALCRLIAEVYCRRAAARWFVPEPGALRLFSRGGKRPIQEFRSLIIPRITLPSKFAELFEPGREVRSRQIDLASFADGLVIGAGAYAAAVASSAETHSRLAELPSVFDRIDVVGTRINAFEAAQQVGYENWLKGHIGEAVAAEVLSSQGHEVAFAPESKPSGLGPHRGWSADER